MSNEREVRLERLTRREVREALAEGKYKAAIIATGSIEQHLEHLALEQDIASSTHIAEQVALKLYPKVITCVPINVGIAEHHMHSAGTLTTKPGAWLSVVFDAVDSLVRHGIKNVLVLNGHGGNKSPVYGVIGQWQQYLAREHEGANLRFNNYWDVLSHEFVDVVQKTPGFPSHAREFETSFTMHVHPENVRPEAIQHSEDEGASAATAETGKQLVEKIIDGVAQVVEDMLSGKSERQRVPAGGGGKRQKESDPVY